MLTRIVLLAAKTPADLPPNLQPQQPSKLFGLSLQDILLILGVVAIICLALFIVVYVRRRGGREHLSRTGRAVGRNDHYSESRSEERVRVRKRRRRHPDNLPRNPTLGETGGLPPARPDEPAQTPT
jgi:hypothetical protein